MKDEKTVMPVSTDPKGAYGISGCSLSVPAIVGRNGVEGLVPVAISEAERNELSSSADVLKKNIASLGDAF
jgi:L-lactate dehydrogenase